MAKTKISEYSATANSNTDVASINIDEGCAPSGINNAIRAVMGHLKDFQSGTNADPFNGPVNGTLGATTPASAAVTTLTTSSTVTHNGGTANGVAYLNGSKVLTTGSALSYNGTTLSTTYANNAFTAGLTVTNSTNGASAQARIDIINSAGNALVAIQNSPSVNSGVAFVGTSSTQALTFGTTYTEQMRLDSGNLLVGTTSALNGSVKGLQVNSTDWASTLITSAASGGLCSIMRRSASTGEFVAFQYTTTSVGSISTNGTTTSYNTSSDYRLKDITGPITGAEAKAFVMALQPKQGSWKADGSPFAGFLAHEFQSVSPSSVSGEKDAVDAEGKPVMQAMQASSPEVMANLVALIQEQQAMIEQLKADVAALKAA